MATYCQAGNIARVTLPDGSIQDFSDTPIDILVSKKFDTLNKRITIAISSMNARFIDGSIQVVEDYNHFYQGVAPGNILDVGVIRQGNFTSLPLQVGYEDWHAKLDRVFWWTNSIYWNFGWTWGGDFRNYKIFDHTNTQLTPKYVFDIKDKEGDGIFYQEFDLNNYSVECIQGCPPNTLDCGDCCLPCADTYNQISGIRALLSRIK